MLSKSIQNALAIARSSTLRVGPDTVIPPSYDALTSEAYLACTYIDERETEIPPPALQLDLELACMGLETW
jgi:hypothetical protein